MHPHIQMCGTFFVQNTKAVAAPCEQTHTHKQTKETRICVAYTVSVCCSFLVKMSTVTKNSIYYRNNNKKTGKDITRKATKRKARRRRLRHFARCVCMCVCVTATTAARAGISHRQSGSCARASGSLLTAPYATRETFQCHQHLIARICACGCSIACC